MHGTNALGGVATQLSAYGIPALRKEREERGTQSSGTGRETRAERPGHPPPTLSHKPRKDGAPPVVNRHTEKVWGHPSRYATRPQAFCSYCGFLSLIVSVSVSPDFSAIKPFLFCGSSPECQGWKPFASTVRRKGAGGTRITSFALALRR